MNILKELQIEKEKTEQQIQELKQYIEKYGELSAKYKLTCSSSHNIPQYFINGKYVTKKDLKLVKTVAQIHYSQRVLNELERKAKDLRRLLQHYEDDALDQIYMKQCDGRKKIVEPVQEPKEQFIRSWKSEKYEPFEKWEDSKTFFYTIHGEKVRSKAEKMIADEFASYNIPYKYEYPLELKVGKQKKIFRPDFIVLNCNTRKEFIVEHLGMMDKFGYYNASLNKIGVLEQNGYLFGKNLLILHETSENPIDILTLRKYIENFLL